MTTNSKSRALVSAGFKPWAIKDGRELTSYPWAEHGVVKINAREIPGDPTSIRTFEIIYDANFNDVLAYLPCQRCRQRKPDVTERRNGYVADLDNNPDATWVACDSCNEANNDDI